MGRAPAAPTLHEPAAPVRAAGDRENDHGDRKDDCGDGEDDCGDRKDDRGDGGGGG